MSTGPKRENRGGARPGSGPKPQTLSAKQVGSMLRKQRKWERKHLRTIDDIILAAIYGHDFEGNPIKVDGRSQASYAKLWKELTVPKITAEPGVDRAMGPAVFLPEQRPDLKVIEGGKTA